jgi:hypothetical protein
VHARRSVRPLQLVAALCLASAGLRYWGASQVPSPWIVPDEFSYAELARDLYSRGSIDNFYGFVHPLLVGIPLSLTDRPLGYELAKGLQSVAMSLVVVPVYLWGRRLMSSGWALVAATLTVAIPGLAYTGMLMTEVVFYPVATLALWAMARTLEQPTLGFQALASGAIVLAAATRLQGAILAPALLTAAVLFAVIERDRRWVLRLWPTAAALAAAAVAYVVWRLAPGGPWSEVLGGYSDATETSYSVGGAVRYTYWHAADLVLLTGVMPACAVALLALRTFRGREMSIAVRAYIAVTLSAVGWFLVEIGIFTSRHVGHLAERSLLGLAPLLFLGFALWLARGAPRSRLATGVVVAGAVALVASLPVARLASGVSLWDTFTLIPLWRLEVHAEEAPLRLIVVVVAAVLAVAFALVPWRYRLALPAALLVGFAALSVLVTRELAAFSTSLRDKNVGPNPQWIDQRARGSVAFLYSHEILWTSTYVSRFWNAQLDRVVYYLGGAALAGPIAQRPVELREDGLLLADGRPLEADNVVVPRTMTVDGTLLADAPTVEAELWSVRPPVRVREWAQLNSEPGGIRSMTLLVYGCRPGTLRLELLSQRTDQTVVISQGGKLERRLQLKAGQQWRGEIAGRPQQPVGSRVCTFQVDSTIDLIAEPIVEYVPTSADPPSSAGGTA